MRFNLLRLNRYWNIQRDFYLDRYTILSRIELTTWTLCAFRVLNPRQWSLAKQSKLKVEKWCQKVPYEAKAKRDGVINPQNYNFSQF